MIKTISHSLTVVTKDRLILFFKLRKIHTQLQTAERELITYTAKKNKGADVLDFDCTIIIPEQNNAIYFLLISSLSLNTVKFQNRQNNLFFTKDVWAIPLKIICFDMPHRLLRGSEGSLFHLVLLFH